MIPVMAGELSPRDAAGEDREDLVVIPQIGDHPQRGGEGHVIGTVEIVTRPVEGLLPSR